VTEGAGWRRSVPHTTDGVEKNLYSVVAGSFPRRVTETIGPKGRVRPLQARRRVILVNTLQRKTRSRNDKTR
jgi:hypothetical protein